MSINCVIIDDEPLALDLMENYISRSGQLHLVARYEDPIEAFNEIKDLSIDLIFLDIEMPELSGLELAELIGGSTKVIFTTAYREYAADSYDLNAVDYLLKPFSFNRFLKAIAKVNTPSQDETSQNDTTSIINVKSDNKIYRVAYQDIVYIESFKDFIKVHTVNKSLTSYQHISQLADDLPNDMFLRIHRSFLVSIEHIESFSATSISIAGEELPIGRTYKESVSQKLNKT